MLTVNITISGNAEVQKRLKAFEGDLNDWHSTFNNVADYLMDVYQRQTFMTEGGVLGIRWSDLNPQYELWKAKHYAGRGILEASGTLKKGFKKRVGSQDLEIWNPVTYGVYHQQGRGVPERQFIGMTDDMRRRVVQYFVDGITGKIKRAFS